MNSIFAETSNPTRQLVARFFVPGEPVSKSRARFTKRGSKTFAYTPQKTLDGEAAIAAAYLKEAGKLALDPDATFAVHAVFKNGTRQRRDVDNMVKLILDGLNGIAWPDDNQVTEIAARKSWGTKADAGTDVEIYVIGEMNPPMQPCAYCGTEFRTYDCWKDSPKGKKYCKPECFYQHGVERRSRTCEHCKAEFLAWGESKETRFCSIPCAADSKRASVDCTQCGNPFTKQKVHVRKANYCSTECKTESAKSRRSKHFPGTCTICGGGTTRKEYTRCQPCKSAQESVKGRPKK